VLAGVEAVKMPERVIEAGRGGDGVDSRGYFRQREKQPLERGGGGAELEGEEVRGLVSMKGWYGFEEKFGRVVCLASHTTSEDLLSEIRKGGYVSLVAPAPCGGRSSSGRGGGGWGGVSRG